MLRAELFQKGEQGFAKNGAEVRKDLQGSLLAVVGALGDGPGGCFGVAGQAYVCGPDAARGNGIFEDAVPVRPEVRSACDLLGLEPIYCANEGKLVCICAKEDAARLLETMKQVPEGKDAAFIGRVTEDAAERVVMRTALGGRRILQKLAGAQLPRIC